MATRYSGTGRVLIRWVDQIDSYKCTVIDGDGNRARVTVSALARSVHAVDHPLAYDEAARAAIAFALADMENGITADGFETDATMASLHVGRTLATAYPDLNPRREPTPC